MKQQLQRWPIILAFLLLFIGGLASSRLLYELFFLRLLWLGRPFGALLFALFVAAVVAVAHKKWGVIEQTWWVWLPLLLNVIYLFKPDVDLITSRLWFGVGVWGIVLLAASQKDSFKSRQGVLLLLLALLPVYLLTMPNTVGRADTFEFQVVTPQLGIVHPTGYPLYLLLGRVFTLLPISSVAWRLNLGTMVYGLAALSILYLLSVRLTRSLGARQLLQVFVATVAAIAVGLTPTFWSQAIEAEVYTLHGLVVMVALWQILAIGDLQLTNSALRRRILWLAATIGLGLTNHLTSVFLLPAAGLAVLWRQWNGEKLISWRLVWQSAVSFLLPLLLYAYLPIRWLAVNGEPMGIGRFVDWVVGGRFQDALQWSAWLNDMTRYGIVGRLYLDNWGVVNLLIAGVGLAYLLWKQRVAAILLLVTWFGYSFYALNYYVPDLAVFILPGHLVIGLWWAAGITAVLHLHKLASRGAEEKRRSFHLLRTSAPLLLPLLLFLPTLAQIPTRWSQLDRSGSNELLTWGEGVLAQPLETNAAILADSEKIAPLYYLQQAEGVRPDLDIMVLPDEAAYRAELNGRLAQNQPVYLARFLPGLEGSYHLRSAGPLTEVSTEPLTRLPAEAVVAQQTIGPLQLLGYALEPSAAIAPTETAVTLFWQASEPVDERLHVYIRWQGKPPILPTGQHPANNDYPTVAWKGAEIVSDFHLLPQPVSEQAQNLTIEVALAPPFTSAAQLQWHAVTQVDLPPTERRLLERPLRAQLGTVGLDAIEFSTQVRPQTPLPLLLSGYGNSPADLQFELAPITQFPRPASAELPAFSRLPSPFVASSTLETDLPNGRYQLIVRHPESAAACSWFARPTDGCVVGEIEISGVALPPSATNFADKIALIDIELPQTELQPGGLLDVTLTWQALAPLAEDYTVFIQVLDENDKLVGQVDAWPLQGTYPTSQWQLGETITDPYRIQLAPDLPDGDYRLQAGFYLLATLQRLSVVDINGAPIDDKFLLPGLHVQ